MKMRVWMVLGVLAVAGVAMAADKAEEKTIPGEVVGIQCYMAGRSGAGHAQCARSCAEKGNPIGLVAIDDEGKETLYLILGGGGKAAKDYMLDYMGKEVEVTGTVTKKNGMNVITVTKVSELGDDMDWLPSPGVGSGSIQNQE